MNLLIQSCMKRIHRAIPYWNDLDYFPTTTLASLVASRMRLRRSWRWVSHFAPCCLMPATLSALLTAPLDVAVGCTTTPSDVSPSATCTTTEEVTDALDARYWNRKAPDSVPGRDAHPQWDTGLTSWHLQQAPVGWSWSSLPWRFTAALGPHPGPPCPCLVLQQ